MHRPSTRFKWSRAALACVFSTALVFQVPSPVIAEEGADVSSEVESDSASSNGSSSASSEAKKAHLRQQMQVAQQTLANLGAAAEMAEYELVTVSAQLDQTIERINELDEKIPQTEEQLGSAKSELATIVADNYKNGTPTLLDVFMDSASFDDLVTRIEYANRVSEYKSGVVSEVKDLNQQLNQQRIDLEVEKVNQEELVAKQQDRLAAVEAAAAQAQSYYSSLSSELQQLIAAEQAAAQRAAQDAARGQTPTTQQGAAEQAIAATQPQAAQAQAQSQGSQSQGQQSASDQPDSSSAQQETSSTSETDYSDDYADLPSDYSVDFSYDTTYTSTWISDMPAIEAPVEPSEDVSEFVERAFSIIGAGYQWSGYSWTGDPFSSAFTCSGVVDFARGMPSRSSSPETLMAEVGPRLVYSTSELQYGDLVFYACLGRAPGHVAIYIGNGQVIDSIPNGGVAVRAVDYMTPMGGGPIY